VLTTKCSALTNIFHGKIDKTLCGVSLPFHFIGHGGADGMRKLEEENDVLTFICGDCF
jgi:hypothetical protein